MHNTPADLVVLMDMRATTLLVLLVQDSMAGAPHYASRTSSPPQSVVDLLVSKGHTDMSSIAVVGNGPLSLLNRARIATFSIVFRFNDVNNKWSGEKTTVRVVRHPSWFTFKKTVKPEWHVSPYQSDVPVDAAVVTYVYESQHGTENTAPPNSQLFPSCDCGPACSHASGWAGPSTGGAALSLLQEVPNITAIHVFGMNWNGDADMHTDFANSSIVAHCCTKCVIHVTKDDSYGPQLVGGMLVLVIVASSVCLCTSVFASQAAVSYARKHPPFLPLNPSLHHSKKDLSEGDSEAASSLERPLLNDQEEQRMLDTLGDDRRTGQEP